MPEYLSPGVYVEEVDTGSKPIEGVSTSTSAMVGVTERGPVNVPILVTSTGQYARMFGGRLNPTLYPRPHNYIPHAVDGFFTNGGQRLYVVRVLDVGAAERAATRLFDRGTDASADTLLLRAVNAGTGTAAALPRLYVLDDTLIAGGDWIRIGTGSRAEYRRVSNKQASNHVPLDLPLVRPHDADATIDDFDRDSGTVVGRFTLDAATEAGDQVIRVDGAVSDIGTLRDGAIGPGVLVEIGPQDRAEYRYAVHGVVDMTSATGDGTARVLNAPGAAQFDIAIDVDNVVDIVVDDVLRVDPGGGTEEDVVVASVAGSTVSLTGQLQSAHGTGEAVLRLLNTNADLELDEPLVLDHDDGDDVTSLDPTAHINGSDTLETAANIGDTVAFLNDRLHFLPNRYVRIDEADTEHREVRRIGTLGELALASGAYGEYEAASIVQEVTLTDAQDGVVRTLTADAPPSATVIVVDDVTNIAPGDVLRIDPGSGVEEDMLVASVVGTNVNLTGELASPHTAGDAVSRLSAFVLTAEAQASSRTVALSGRMDILAGPNVNIHGAGPTSPAQILRIDGAPNDEYIAIDEVNNPNPTQPPDPGTVSLMAGLQRAHPHGAFVYVQVAPTLAASQPSATVFNVDDGGGTLWLSDGSGYAPGDWIRVTTPGGQAFYHRITGHDTANVSQVEVQNPPFARSHVMGAPVVERAQLILVEALDHGFWGDRLRVSTEDEPDGLVQNTQLRLVNLTSATEIRLDSALGVEPGTVLEFSNGAGVIGALQKVDAIDRRTGTINLAPGLDPDQQNALAAGPLGVRSREFRLTVRLLRQPDPAVPSRNDTVLDSEEFRYLSMDSRHSQYFARIIGDIDGEPRPWDLRPEGESLYIRVRDPVPAETVRLGPENLVDILPSGRGEPAQRALGGGFDAIATLSDVDHYVGADAREPEERTGMQSLRNVEDVSIVSCPGRVTEDVQRGLIEHCEAMRYRFAVLDGPAPVADTLTDVQRLRQRYDTKYAALYHPWLLMSDPYPRNLAEVSMYPIPPSGHMMGVYARTDVERGVHKSPANEVVRGIRGLRRLINKREHDLLNPKNINVIRDFRQNNRGIRAWGARVITSDSDWKYVNVRRLLIFIEFSIERGTQWVVFEPNAEPLWARVRRTIRNFLTVVWRDGALEGTTTEEAFFVKCDRTTMTQTDIDNGRLICEIGVAPVKPAEFVIFRIGLWTAHADE